MKKYCITFVHCMGVWATLGTKNLRKYVKFKVVDMKRTSLLLACALLLSSCDMAKKTADAPFFEMRGLVLAWDDLSNPEVIDWFEIMKTYDINTISVFGKDYQSEEYKALKQKCIDSGIDFEYEEHAMSWLLPHKEA